MFTIISHKLFIALHHLVLTIVNKCIHAYKKYICTHLKYTIMLDFLHKNLDLLIYLNWMLYFKFLLGAWSDFKTGYFLFHTKDYQPDPDVLDCNCHCSSEIVPHSWH